MPYGPRYGRMEDPAEAVVSQRQARKLQLVEAAVKEQDLSWQIKTRYGEEVWPVLAYDLQRQEDMPGAMIIVDRDTDMDVKIYPAGMWFSMEVVYFVDGQYKLFTPRDAYLADLADRLIEEEQQKE
jgi:hypothetical protein